MKEISVLYNGLNILILNFMRLWELV